MTPHLREGEAVKPHGFIVVNEWRKFQHYKDRNPVWIKNYTALMNDDDYLCLSGHRRAILHGLWLEYAMSRCRIRVDTVLLTRRLNLRVTTKDLEALNHAGFIHFSASAPLAEPEQDASPEGEREEEEIPRAVTALRTPTPQHDEPNGPDEIDLKAIGFTPPTLREIA